MVLSNIKYFTRRILDKLASKSKFLVSVALSKTGSVDRKDSQGNTPLLQAIKKKDSRLIKYLLRHGASFAVENSGGETPLHYAVKTGNRDIVELLLKHGADPDINSSNQAYQTPLNLAVDLGDCKLVSLMIKNVDVSNRGSLVSRAVATWNFDMVKVLLKAGVKSTCFMALLSSDSCHVLELCTEDSPSTHLNDGAFAEPRRRPVRERQKWLHYAPPCTISPPAGTTRLASTKS